MKLKLFGFLRHDRRGLALISVLGVVTLATVLIVALFSVSDAEFKSSQVYSAGTSARRFSDSAVNIVIGQIQSAATGSGIPTLSPNGSAAVGQTIWANNAGSVRVYTADGKFVQGRTLYSSSTMVYNTPDLVGEQSMAYYSPAATWAQQPDQWVDLNAPVQRLVPGGPTLLYYPIFDPRSMPPLQPVDAVPTKSSLVDAEGNPSVEGFWVLANTPNPTATGATTLGVVRTGLPETWRLPMPVEWLYVLKDGSVGTVAAASAGQAATWVGGGVAPTVRNPIIGRVAFWTDDECSKININTAGEPGYWAPPNAMHERERHWADSPPALYEWQRYPGHPATVALSSVFAPGFNPKTYYPPPTSYPQSNLDFKNQLYDYVPKLAVSNTRDGQIAFEPNDILLGGDQTRQDIKVAENNIKESLMEPLFNSVDESMFKTAISSRDSREVRTLVGPSGNQIIGQSSAEASAIRLQRARQFLTAHSKAPETNMFGLPRVAIWPVPDSAPPAGGGDYKQYRTAYDTEIALCAKLGSTTGFPELETSQSYYFRRLDPSSHLADMGKDPKSGGGKSGLSRNNQLMNYLNNLIHQTMPGGASFNTKYDRGDAQQILVEIFDYIRCTNLYDGILARGNPDASRRDNSLPDKLTQPPTVLWDAVPRRDKYFTYTVPRFTVKRTSNDAGMTSATVQAAAQYNQSPEWLATGTFPGHGQVKPIEWSDSSGKTFKGFGRFPTISEVGLQFICTGDGKPDNGSYLIQSVGKTFKSGGKTAEYIDPSKWNQRITIQTDVPGGGRGEKRQDYWYSNIPPMPCVNLYKAWGCNFTHLQQNLPDNPRLHPGAHPNKWNLTLEYGSFEGQTSGIPLAAQEMRIQVCLMIETFIPAVGYTRYTPDFTLVLNPKQMAGIKVMNAKGQMEPVFSSNDPKIVVQSSLGYTGDTSGRGLNASSDVSPLGGHNAPSALMIGRLAPGDGKTRMTKDPGYIDASSGSAGNIHSIVVNYPLLSNFFTVKARNGAGDTPGTLQDIQFQVESPIEIDIYATHDYAGTLDPANGSVVQRVNVNFPSGIQKAPPPQLVVYSNETIDTVDQNGNRTHIDSIPAPHWWAFHDRGAVNRYLDQPGAATFSENSVSYNLTPTPDTTINGQRTYGRFHATGYSGSVGSSGARNGGVPASGLTYVYSNFSGFAGVLSDPNRDVVEGVYTAGANPAAGKYPYFGSDMVRSLIPRHGDYRIFAARKVVDGTSWQRHPIWATYPDRLFAHSFSGAYSNAIPGFDRNGGTNKDENVVDAKWRMVKDAWYDANAGLVPDTPLTPAAVAASSRYRDWDNGPGNLRDGPYINKPDDGSMGVMKFWHGHGATDKSGVQSGYYIIKNTYFTNSFLQLPSTNAFFTPNRIIASPGMFGSLPTGVWGSLAKNADPLQAQYAQTDGIPWRTLLFRADVDGHVGAPSWVKADPDKAGSGGVSPADHYFMDLFFMPIVEPYAITDSYATAGKINLNYQIVPFTYIRRATAVYAAMKGEMITAYSSASTNPTKGGQAPGAGNPSIYKSLKDGIPLPPTLWNDSDGMYWQREINLDETVKQLDERFAFKGDPVAVGSVGLMLSPSQVCELHLIPLIPAGTLQGAKGTVVAEPNLTNLGPGTRRTAMKAYWAHNDLTGDNTRERPYTNLYQKFTTRSNTFRVYFTAQTLKKARSLQPTQVDTRKDSVTAEYRGSALIERYLDLSTAGSTQLQALDYGSGVPLSTFKNSLEKYYHYRIVENKQFAP